MEVKDLKQGYVSPQIRVIKVLLKNSILNISAGTPKSYGTVDNMRQGGHLSIGRNK